MKTYKQFLCETKYYLDFGEFDDTVEASSELEAVKKSIKSKYDVWELGAHEYGVGKKNYHQKYTVRVKKTTLSESFFPAKRAFFTFVSVYDEELGGDVVYIYNITTKTQSQMVDLKSKLNTLGWKFHSPTEISKKFTKYSFYYKSEAQATADIKELSPA